MGALQGGQLAGGSCAADPPPSHRPLTASSLSPSLFPPKQADPNGAPREYFLGSGGVLGLLGALTGQPMPGGCLPPPPPPSVLLLLLWPTVGCQLPIPVCAVQAPAPRSQRQTLCKRAQWPSASPRQASSSCMACCSELCLRRCLLNQPAAPCLQSAIRRVRQRAAGGDRDCAQLELDLFR